MESEAMEPEHTFITVIAKALVLYDGPEMQSVPWRPLVN